MIAQLRKSFPKEVTAETLKKLGLATNNESYVINVLKFLGIIDEEGRKVDTKVRAFVQHQDDAFQAEFGKLIGEVYEELFQLHGESAWTLSRDDLKQFFRTAANSSDKVGGLQALTFAALAALAGHQNSPKPKPTPSPKRTKSEVSKVKQAKVVSKTEAAPPPTISAEHRPGEPGLVPGVGLTVRIEVNLPAAADQETYDRIFQSIRTNLINGY